MRVKIAKKMLCFMPLLLFVVCLYMYYYGISHKDSVLYLVISTVISSKSDSDFNGLLALRSNDYIYNINIVEENDTDKSIVIKNNVANLSNWVLPISGNYTITTYYSSYHRGIDYYSYNGYDSDIYAPNNGTVYYVSGGCYSGNLSCNGGRGNYMIINHNNGEYYTLYMHLHNIYVNVADDVSSGDVIASMGNTGYVIPCPSSYNIYGGTHLHFEVYIGIPDKGGYTINPMELY